MKRLILFLVAVLFTVITVNSQTYFQQVRKTEHTVDVPTGLVSPDSLLTLNQVSSQTFVFDISTKAKIQLYSIYVNMTIGDNNDADTDMVSILQKSPDNTNWYGIDTVNYRMTVDTIFVFEDLSTGISAQYLRVYNNMTSVGDTCTLVSLRAKLYDK